MWHLWANLPDDERPEVVRLALSGKRRLAMWVEAIHLVLLVLVLLVTREGRIAAEFFLTAPAVVVIVLLSICGMWNIRLGWLRGYVQSLLGLVGLSVMWIALGVDHRLERYLPSCVQFLVFPEVAVVTAVVAGELAVRIRMGQLVRKSVYDRPEGRLPGRSSDKGGS
jgi:hypothetical protein